MACSEYLPQFHEYTLWRFGANFLRDNLTIGQMEGWLDDHLTDFLSVCWLDFLADVTF